MESVFNTAILVGILLLEPPEAADDEVEDGPGRTMEALPFCNELDSIESTSISRNISFWNWTRRLTKE